MFRLSQGFGGLYSTAPCVRARSTGVLAEPTRYPAQRRPWIPWKRRGAGDDETTAPMRWREMLVLILITTPSWPLNARPAEPAGKGVAARVATCLEGAQLKEGANPGVWPSEVLFTGPATTGMACAYEWMADPAYLQAAEMGGEFILSVGDATGHLLGDEAYALVGLSELSQDPQDNRWRAALVEFYASLRRNEGETTAQYIDLLKQEDSSANVFYVAHHTVAAYYVDDLDNEVWREALIRCLASVDDASDWPVQALGVATWALARTGNLGGTLVDPLSETFYWSGVTLRDLPALLLRYQIPEGELFAGSFYWHFDHSTRENSVLVGGWTEDTVYGTLGLVQAASRQEDIPAEELDAAILAAYTALLYGPDAEGRVCEHLAGLGETYHAYAGEVLQALWAAQQHLDAQAESTIPEGDETPTQE